MFEGFPNRVLDYPDRGGLQIMLRIRTNKFTAIYILLWSVFEQISVAYLLIFWPLTWMRKWFDDFQVHRSFRKSSFIVGWARACRRWRLCGETACGFLDNTCKAWNFPCLYHVENNKKKNVFNFCTSFHTSSKSMSRRQRMSLVLWTACKKVELRSGLGLQSIAKSMRRQTSSGRCSAVSRLIHKSKTCPFRAGKDLSNDILVLKINWQMTLQRPSKVTGGDR